MKAWPFLMAALLAASPALGGDIPPHQSRLLMHSPHLEALEAQSLTYTHQREMDGRPLLDQNIALRIERDEKAPPRAILTMGARALDPFPASAANPVLLAFMESSVRAISSATGGGVFYIGKRVREAYRQGGEKSDAQIRLKGEILPARRIRFAPFAQDKNRARFGPLKDMVYEFIIAEDAPGVIARLSAIAPDGAFSEIIQLEGVEVLNENAD